MGALNRVVGIDIGSRSIELVVLEGGERVQYLKVPTTFSPLDQCRKLMKDLKVRALVATGYGRNLLLQNEELMGELAERGCKSCSAVTEIKAHSLGAHALFPEARSVLDIGGQDTKVIALGEKGRVLSFEMNDRCAAGTGKFLEFMATALQVSLEEFGAFALTADKDIEINTMCTVFAESEATSHMAKGESANNIAMALHRAIVKRTIAMLKRKNCQYPIYFSGGVAHNECVRNLLMAEFGVENLFIAVEPDMTGALGAALHASQL